VILDIQLVKITGKNASHRVQAALNRIAVFHSFMQVEDQAKQNILNVFYSLDLLIVN